MNRSDSIIARNEAILDGLVLRAESFCPKCKQLVLEAIQGGYEKNNCGDSCYPQAPQSYGNLGSGDPD